MGIDVLKEGDTFKLNVDGEERDYKVVSKKDTEDYVCPACNKHHSEYIIGADVEYTSSLDLGSKTFDTKIKFFEKRHYCPITNNVFAYKNDSVENSSRYGELLNKAYDEFESEGPLFYVYRFMRVAHTSNYGSGSLVGARCTLEEANALIKEDLKKILDASEENTRKYLDEPYPKTQLPVFRRRVTYAISIGFSVTTEGTVY